AGHLGMGTEIERVGAGESGDGVLIDGDLGSVERANGDHAGLSSKIGQGAHCTPPAKSSRNTSELTGSAVGRLIVRGLSRSSRRSGPWPACWKTKSPSSPVLAA